MKKYISKLVCVILVVFVVLTFSFILFSFCTLLTFDTSVSFEQSVQNIYKALATYSELYKFTFIICAFWVTLQQLEVSQNNYNKTSEQVKFIQEDIFNKRNKEDKSEVLKYCIFFFTDLQTSFKELIETDGMNKMPNDWKLLETLIKSSFQQKYPEFYQKMDKINETTKNKILITLYKLEAFSTLIIYGNIDKELGKNIIGSTYIKQISFLLGLISYFREDTESIFGQNTIKLYNEWKTDAEIDLQTFTSLPDEKTRKYQKIIEILLEHFSVGGANAQTVFNSIWKNTSFDTTGKTRLNIRRNANPKISFPIYLTEEQVNTILIKKKITLEELNYKLLGSNFLDIIPYCSEILPDEIIYTEVVPALIREVYRKNSENKFDFETTLHWYDVNFYEVTLG